MPDLRHSWPIRYGLAVVIVGVALLITAAYAAYFTHVSFGLFYVAVVVSTLFGGRGPGLLATALSAISTIFFIVPPTYSLAIGIEAALLVGVFVFAILVINWLMQRVKNAEISTRSINEQLTSTLEKIQFQAHLLDVVQQAVIATDLDGKIVYWNQFAEKLYGWKSEEVVGRDIVQVVPSGVSRDKADEIMAQLRSGEFLARRRNGTEIPIRVLDSPVFDDNGKQVGTVGISEGISGRIRADREKARLNLAIEEQRMRLDNIVASVPGVVWEAWGKPDAASQRIDFVSNHVEPMLGYSVSDWLSTPNFWLQIVHEKDKERAAEEAMSIFAKGSGTSQFRWVAKDGRVLTVEAQSVVVYDDEGQPIGMRGVTLDITERKRSEDALRESEERFHIMADTAPVKIWLSDTDGQFQYVNKRWLGFTGRKIEEELGYGWTERAHPDDLERCLKVYKSSIEARQEFTIEYRLRRHDDEYIWALFSGVPRLLPDKSCVGYIGSCIDITARKRVEEKQAEHLALAEAARSQAEFANRTKDDFLATLSHELRTPLTAMLGWTWMLRYRTLDEETFRRAVETIDRNVHMQAHLIDDLLDVSRIITGNLRLEVCPVDLVMVIEAAVDTVRPAAMAKEIQLVMDLDHSAKNVICDAARMQQVAWNLLSNAVKFTPKNGTVTMLLRRVNERIEICVRDTGKGISADFLPYVFDRFRQADSSTTRTQGGLGLGLAIVRHLVELHGGTVSVTSDGVDRGSTFAVTMPVVAVTADLEAEPA